MTRKHRGSGRPGQNSKHRDQLKGLLARSLGGATTDLLMDVLRKTAHIPSASFTEEMISKYPEAEQKIIRRQIKGAISIDDQKRRTEADIAKNEPFHLVATYSNLTLTREDFKRCRLEDLQREHRPHTAEVMQWIPDWNPETVTQGFFLYGGVGSGKTRILKGLGIKWAQKHKTVQFWPVPALMRKFKEFDMGSKYQNAFRKRLVDADILIIDDLGAENTTDFVRTELLSIIDDRTQRNGSLHISANMGPGEISRIYGDRMLDRLRQLTKSFLVNDPSFRGKPDGFWSD